MILAQYSNISFGFHDKTIVEDFSMMLQTKCRIGLIGTNGSGKTTLLKLLAGELSPDKGTIVLARDIRIGFLRQTPDVPLNYSVQQVLLKPFEQLLRMEAEMEKISLEMGTEPAQTLLDHYDRIQEGYRRAGGYVFRSRIEQVMQGLGFSTDDSKRLIGSFSGGEQARIMLARLLLEDPDLMLLDEPTNHLDIHAVEYLEQYLETFAGGVMLISHDRYFLDRVAKTIIELAWQKCEIYNGNYSAHRIEKVQRDAIRHKHFQLQQKHISRIEDYIRRNMAAQKTKQAQSRVKELDRLERLEDINGSTKAMKLQFKVNRSSGQTVFETHALTKEFDGRTLFKNTSLILHRGDRIGLIGPNGSGKSTFLKIMTEQVTPEQGEVKWGYHVKYALFDQHLHDLDDKIAVIDEVWKEKPGLLLQEIRDHLGRFLFSADEVFKLVGSLSGGERARVALAKLFLKDANLLLLDEPTNHLDLDARESLEDALRDYPGTIILVTHDRYLLDKITNKLWVLDNLKISEHLGNYTDFRNRALQNPVSVEADVADPDGTFESKSRKTRKEQRLARLEVRKKTGRSAAFYEKEIARIEGEILTVEEKIANPEISHDWTVLKELTEAETILRNELNEVFELWELAVEAEKDLET